MSTSHIEDPTRQYVHIFNSLVVDRSRKRKIFVKDVYILI